MKSKRKNRRLSIVGIAYLKVNKDKKAQEVYLANFSRGGVGIYLNKPVKVGTEIYISFTNRDIEGEKIFEDQPGVIIWCARCGSVYAAGIRFN